MRILVLSWRDPKHPLAGGAEQVMHEHMKGWIKMGHKVTLFTSKFKKSPVEERIDGVYIVRRGYQYLGVQLAAFLYYLRNGKNYDFVIDQFHGLPFFTSLYVRKPKLAVIQEVAREVWFLNPLPRPLNWLIGLIGYLGEPFVLLFYKNTHFLTGSPSTRDDLERFGIPPKNISIVNHGIVVSQPSPTVKRKKKKTITYLGMLSKDKGIEDALECFYLLDKKSQFQFWVIGRAETISYGEKLKNIVHKLGLKEKVKFWGFVSQEKKYQLLARSHVLVNPSVREGWGLVNIEANTVKTPVVAYRSPGLIDSINDGESGILCYQNTPECLAKNIFHLLHNPYRLQKMQQGALRWSQNFSWEKSTNLSLKLLDRISKLYRHKRLLF